MRKISSDHLEAVTGMSRQSFQDLIQRGIVGDQFGERRGKGRRVRFAADECCWLSVFQALAGGRRAFAEVAPMIAGLWPHVVAWQRDQAKDLVLIIARSRRGEVRTVARLTKCADQASTLEHMHERAAAEMAAAADLAEQFGEIAFTFEVVDISALLWSTFEAFNAAATEPEPAAEEAA